MFGFSIKQLIVIAALIIIVPKIARQVAGVSQFV